MCSSSLPSCLGLTAGADSARATFQAAFERKTWRSASASKLFFTLADHTLGESMAKCSRGSRIVLGSDISSHFASSPRRSAMSATTSESHDALSPCCWQ